MRLVATMRECANRRLLLIIDNIDIICHVNDRGLYHQYDECQETLVSGVVDIVSLFYHDAHQLGDIGANVLLVVRHDTYQILRQAGETSRPLKFYSDDANAYEVLGTPWPSVLDTRAMLMNYVTSGLQDIALRQRLERLTSIIRVHLLAQFGKAPPLVEHLQKITNKGLREMMEYFAQYSWVPHEDEPRAYPAKPIQRFVHQYPVGLLTFMLGRRRRFNQQFSHFPNIYLVSWQAHAHPQTYWLKRLICHFVMHAGETRAGVTPDLVLRLFCGEGGYDPLLIEESLGSLTDANCSNMVRATRGPHPDGRKLIVKRMEMTERGVHCLKHIFDRFFYLQLIVDDHELPVPHCVLKEMGFSSKTPDYGYVVSPVDRYHEYAHKMVQQKARQVLIFLELLDLSLKWEREYHSSVFDRLQTHGVKLPEMGEVKAGVAEELQSLSDSWGGLLDVPKLQAYANDWRPALDDLLFETFERNHQATRRVQQ